jgi:CRP-like cAMP-binding protein
MALSTESMTLAKSSLRAKNRPVVPREDVIFLAGLSVADRSALEERLRPVSFAVGDTLHEVGEIVPHVHFLASGLAAELVAYDDGAAALAQVVGSEGIIGAAAGLVKRPSVTRAVALRPVTALRIEAPELRGLIRSRPGLRAAFDVYWTNAMAETALHAGCAACHRLDQRLRSLLLQCEARGGSERIELTHEQLCQLLGSQRTTVTTISRNLKLSGVIKSGRGWMRILDRDAMERKSCGCHRLHIAWEAEPVEAPEPVFA